MGVVEFQWLVVVEEVVGVEVVVVGVVINGVDGGFVSKQVPGGATSSFTQLLVFGSNTKLCGKHL